jgi:hypothetical protein
MRERERKGKEELARGVENDTIRNFHYLVSFKRMSGWEKSALVRSETTGAIEYTMRV